VQRQPSNWLSFVSATNELRHTFPLVVIHTFPTIVETCAILFPPVGKEKCPTGESVMSTYPASVEIGATWPFFQDSNVPHGGVHGDVPILRNSGNWRYLLLLFLQSEDRFPGSWCPCLPLVWKLALPVPPARAGKWRISESVVRSQYPSSRSKPAISPCTLHIKEFGEKDTRGRICTLLAI
jgi:hypothetical protein